MLNYQDQQKMSALMEKNEDFKDIIQKLLEDQRFTISKIAHEIGNPLTLISSSLQLIETAHPEVANYKHWPETKTDIQFLRNLLQDLSSLNHSDTVNFTPVDLSQLLSEIESSYSARSEYISNRLTFEYNNQLPFIKGNMIKLRQAIANLINNSLDAIDDTGTVCVRLFQSSQILQLEVEDSGCGISEEIMPCIFTPFTTFKQGGTGLGLTITDRIINAHKARLTVHSIQNKGTTFVLKFPILGASYVPANTKQM